MKMIDFSDERYRLDDLQCKGHVLLQDTKSFCFGIDSVLIAHFTAQTIKKNAHIVDLGCGNGIIPILLAAKCDTLNITGIELNEKSAALAQYNVEKNVLETRINILHADFKNADAALYASYDAAVTNPPYIPVGGGAASPNNDMAGARHEIHATLKDVIDSAKKLLKNNGRFYMIHRAQRTAEIIAALKEASFTPKRMQFVHSSAEDNAAFVMIEAYRYGGDFMTVLSPIVIYDANGAYSDQINKIYGRSGT
jgi:tRNA1(Val) A37 N6-methylase TrmN6